MPRTFCSFSLKISMLQHWSLDQRRLASATSNNHGFGALANNQKMMEHGWMIVSDYTHGKYMLYSHMCQLKGCTGSVLKHNLKDGWKSRIVSIMRPNGSLLTFMPRQTFGGI